MAAKTKEIAGQTVLTNKGKGQLGVNHNSLRPAAAEIERFIEWYTQEIVIDSYTLPVVLTIQTRAKKSNKLGHFLAAYDWEDAKKPAGGAWSSREGKPAHEINIVPEIFKNDPLDILTTVAHEVVHMYNWNTQVKDTAKSGRHNGEFKDAAEGFGLVVEKTEQKSIGYTTVGFDDETRKRIDKEFKPDVAAFAYFKGALIEKPPARKTTVAFHVPEDDSAPLIRLAKGKAEAADGNLTWKIGDKTLNYVRKAE